MIPPFDDFGNLPPGIHRATLEEIEARFGRESETRRVQMESIRWMIDLARRAGIQRVILNGSFVPDIIEPNDVDCVLLRIPAGRQDRGALKELRGILPFLDIEVVGRKGFDRYVNVLFAAGRLGASKGMIEVII